MIPVSYELKRLIAEFGVPWKPEIRKWLISAPVYVITIGKDGELWGKTREGLVLPHDSILFEWEFPPTGIWSHFTVFALQCQSGFVAYPFLRERATRRWTTAQIECGYDRAGGYTRWLPNPDSGTSSDEYDSIVKSVLALVFAVADALERRDGNERTDSVSLTRRRQFAGPGVSGWVYRTLDIGPALSRQQSDSHGTHASPRWHIRRGHWRTLAGGRKTFVRECEVGDPARGGVIKDYRIQTEARA
jgi:hypothetical protein